MDLYILDRGAKSRDDVENGYNNDDKNSYADSKYSYKDSYKQKYTYKICNRYELDYVINRYYKNYTEIAVDKFTYFINFRKYYKLFNFRERLFLIKLNLIQN